jgi:hypothetical protein
VAAESQVVNLQPLHASAGLASPAITFENLSMKFAICFRVKTHLRLLQDWFVHEA